VLFYVLIVCTVTLPPGVNPIAVDKYIYLSIYLKKKLCVVVLNLAKVRNYQCQIKSFFSSIFYSLFDKSFL